MDSLTIGGVAKQAAVGVETIRFYEREGLIDKPPRRASGYRQYPPETTQRIRFIKRAKGLGFSLKEIRELLSLRALPRGKCANVLRKAEAKISDIQQKIELLQEMSAALTKLTRECRGSRPRTECPILGALDEGENL